MREWTEGDRCVVTVEGRELRGTVATLHPKQGRVGVVLDRYPEAAPRRFDPDELRPLPEGRPMTEDPDAWVRPQIRFRRAQLDAIDAKARADGRTREEYIRRVACLAADVDPN